MQSYTARRGTYKSPRTHVASHNEKSRRGIYLSGISVICETDYFPNKKLATMTTRVKAAAAIGVSFERILSRVFAFCLL